ncbi:MAG: hypothetical protein MOGMAGMI_02484 [Candidatus Omnitrophica bacterium]|nr:hypothetical protein [Candidatus Omnitrophota bacterium]
MSVNLYLQEPRTVIDEPGGSVFLDFTPGSLHTIKQLVKEGLLATSGVAFSDVAGHFMGKPDYDLTPMDPDDWTQTGTWNTAVDEGPEGWQNLDGTFVAFMQQKADSDWSLEDLAAAAAGQGRFISLLTYDSQTSSGGVGTDSPVTVEFGGVWKLELHDDGNAYLFEKQLDTDTGVTSETARGQFEWMTAEQFRGTLHQLWIYQVQSKLVIANLNKSLEGRKAGFVYRDDGALLDETTVDGDGQPVRNAIRAAKWKVSGGGFCTVNVSNQAWLAGDAEVTMGTTAIEQGGSTQELEATAHGASNGPVAATIVCVDEDGTTWPQGTSTTYRRYGLGWTVSFTSTADHTFFLDAVDVKIPRLLRTEGWSGTDVLAIAGVADKEISLTREGDLTRESLTAQLTCLHQDLAGYTQPNMAVRYVVDSVTRFRGLTSDARWNVISEGTTQSGELSLQAEGLWRRFRKQLWPGGKPFDGRLLTECLAEVLEAGGLDAADYSLASWPVRFADTPVGEAPSFVYRPGTNLDRILEDFQRKFYGTALMHYFRLSDGKFILAQVSNTGSPAATFYAKSSSAAAAGVPGRTIRDGSFDARLDDSELYNVIIVLGQQPDGRPLMARCIDWPSIRDNGVSNYVGEPWPLVVSDPAFQTQAMVNYVCRQLYERHRRPKTYASWVSHRVDLFPGQLVYLSGTNYGFTYRLTGVQLAGGGGMDPAGLATYQGEQVA